MNTNDSIRESDGKVMARFIDVAGQDAIITIMYFDAPSANGWMFSPVHNTMAHLEFVSLPELPFLCQSTIDDMDADAELIEFGRYS